jgi:hypothetical protein
MDLVIQIIDIFYAVIPAFLVSFSLFIYIHSFGFNNILMPCRRRYYLVELIRARRVLF